MESRVVEKQVSKTDFLGAKFKEHTIISELPKVNMFAVNESIVEFSYGMKVDI